jgi:polyhydroxybutyrate depolymerase
MWLRKTTLACIVLYFSQFACRASREPGYGSDKRRTSGEYSMHYQGRKRTYSLRLPQGRETEAGLPLVFALHGAPGDARNLEQNSRLTEKAQREGFIVVYPNGTSAASETFLNWNSGSCCGYAWQSKVDDVGFLRLLAVRLTQEFEADRERIYAIGFSKGGMLAYLLACEAADIFAGIADIAGAFNYGDCRPAREIEILIAHGRKDPAIPFGAGVPERTSPLADDESRPVDFATDFWRRFNGCVAHAPKLRQGAEITRYACERGKLRLIVFTDDGHVWPGALAGLSGAEQARSQLVLNDAVWQFWLEPKKPLR